MNMSHPAPVPWSDLVYQATGLGLSSFPIEQLDGAHRLLLRWRLLGRKLLAAAVGGELQIGLLDENHVLDASQAFGPEGTRNDAKLWVAEFRSTDELESF